MIIFFSFEAAFSEKNVKEDDRQPFSNLTRFPFQFYFKEKIFKY